jgi:2-polyprenyl-6-methoxyphenol hydroxylase-like FAD-dependent oxidoreductase
MRIIIAGAGPAGLVLAHALLAVGLDDFVVLERREDVVETRGAVLGFWPHGLRILDQLGLYEKVTAVATRMGECFNLDTQGRLLWRGDMFGRLEQK